MQIFMKKANVTKVAHTEDEAATLAKKGYKESSRKEDPKPATGSKKKEPEENA